MRERANCHPLFESYDRSGDRKSQKKPRLGGRACLASVKQTHPRQGLLISQNRSSTKFDPRSREASGVSARETLPEGGTLWKPLEERTCSKRQTKSSSSIKSARPPSDIEVLRAQVRQIEER